MITHPSQREPMVRVGNTLATFTLSAMSCTLNYLSTLPLRKNRIGLSVHESWVQDSGVRFQGESRCAHQRQSGRIATISDPFFSAVPSF